MLDDRTGKTLHLPHPVAELRIWNPGKKQYDPMDPHLGGAPSGAEEEEKFWADVLAKFRDEQGADYIDGLIAGRH